MAKVKVIVASNTKQAYNSTMLGARILKCSRDISSEQKMTLRAKVIIKVTMTFCTAYLAVRNAMYNMIYMSDKRPSLPSVNCFVVFQLLMFFFLQLCKFMIDSVKSG